MHWLAWFFVLQLVDLCVNANSGDAFIWFNLVCLVLKRNIIYSLCFNEIVLGYVSFILWLIFHLTSVLRLLEVTFLV